MFEIKVYVVDSKVHFICGNNTMDDLDIKIYTAENKVRIMREGGTDHYVKENIIKLMRC